MHSLEKPLPFSKNPLNDLKSMNASDENVKLILSQLTNEILNVQTVEAALKTIAISQNKTFDQLVKDFKWWYLRI